MWNRPENQIAVFILGFFLDLALGDPHVFPHPVRLMGKLINETEKRLRKNRTSSDAEFWSGTALIAIVLGCTAASAWIILYAAYSLHFYAGMAMEILMVYQILAAKCLKIESMKVYECLKAGGLEQARAAVSMIVGRDTEALNEEEIAKAAIETVAENTCDGVIAPMLYTAFGGPVLGFLYKAVNTMDSMIGYKNDTYLYFGRAAAKLDDIANYVPSRISAVFMIAASFLLGKEFSGKGACYIYRRDSRNHASPNSAQTESACAGALGIRLAGDSQYFGKTVKKPYIGDNQRPVEYEDIKRVNKLMYAAAVQCELLCILLIWGRGILWRRFMAGIFTGIM